MFETQLGKISAAAFGLETEADAIGLKLTFVGPGWGVNTHILTPTVTSSIRIYRKLGDCALVCADIEHLLNDAGVINVQDLVGVPVEVIFNKEGTLVDWRILKEVL